MPATLTLRIMACMVLLGWAGTGRGATLEYRLRSGDEYAYSFNVEAEIGSQVLQIKGGSIYKASQARGAATDDDDQPRTGTGSAFVVNSNGYLVTCAHVVEDATTIRVKLGEKTYTARLVATDQQQDLAIIKISAKDLPVLPLANSKQVQLAQEVRAVGYPLSDVLGSSIKVSRGTISGIVPREGKKLFQVDAPINPGNSGGPLVNNRGAAIGVASAKLAGQAISNVGFAVPANEARRLLEENDITCQGNGAKKALSGPDLAKRVTPAVALVSVTIGAGAGAEQYALRFRGFQELWTRSKESRGAAEKIADKDTDSGRLAVNARGETSDIAGVPSLPFGLGSQGQVGIERLPDSDKKTWSVENVTTVVQALPEKAAIPGVREAVRTTVVLPAMESTEYEITDSNDEITSVKKRYEIKTLCKPGERPLLQMTGEGRFQFDHRQGAVRNMRFTGRLVVGEGSRSLEIPIRYDYKRVDPGSLGRGDVASTQEGDGSSIPRIRPPGAAAKRPAVPTGDARKQAEASVKNVFGQQMAEAKTSAARSKLADKMFRLAIEEKDDTLRFALLNAARTMAVNSGELPTALRTAGEMVRGWKIDAEQAELTILGAVARTAGTRQQHSHVAEFAVELMDEAIEDDNLAVISRLGAVALDAARRARQGDLVKYIVKRGKDFQRIRQVLVKIKPYRDKLEDDPDDPEANLIVGKYLCFYKQDWNAGLPLLVLGGDPLLKTIAEKEIAEPAAGKETLQLADQWWQAAEQHQGNLQQGMRARALKHYQQALPDLSGMTKARIQQKLDEQADLLAAPAAESGHGTSTPPRRLTADRPGSRSGGQAALLERIARAVKARRTLRSKEIGFTLNKQAFATVPDDGGLLVGFDLSMGTFGNSIGAVRPIFLTAKGQTPGPVVGRPSARSARIIAKKGYAVGSLTLNGGIGIAGMGITFMKIEEGGLNPKDAYQAQWIGSRGRDTQLGGDGSPIVGIIGHHDGRKVMSIGVVLVEKP